jgi:Zn-dependent protease/CBS domain-containing protein
MAHIPAPRQTAPPAPSGTIRLLQIFGFDILIHWSWLLIFALLTWSLATGYLPDVYPAWTRGQYWITGAVTSVLFFASVLAHELSHSLVARRRGLPVENITLFVFGGVSALGDEPRSARDEFLIAIVGPLTSFAVAVVFGVLWVLTQDVDPPQFHAIAGYLAYINVAVGIFNLLPGFPLDGGRVLRSAIWGARGSMIEATRIASIVGRVIAGTLIALGILTAFTVGGFGGFWFILIGWFLWSAAENSYQQLLLSQTLHGLTAGVLVEPDVPRVPPNTTLRRLAHDYILGQQRRAFFVAPEDGTEALGLVTLSDLQKAPQGQWDTLTVFQVMTPREKLITITPQTDALTALELMARHDVNQLPVLAGGSVVGLLTRGALMRAIQLRQQIGSV